MALAQLVEPRLSRGASPGGNIEFDSNASESRFEEGRARGPSSRRTSAGWSSTGRVSTGRVRGFVYDGVPASRSVRAGLSKRPTAFHPLPMEDVYFHVKTIDNSQVRRLPDPKSKAMWLQLVGAGVLGLALLVVVLAPRPLLRASGYRIETLAQTRQQMVEVQDQLKVRQAVLSDLRRVTALASRQGLAATPPERFAWQNRTIAPVEGRSALAQNRGLSRP